MKTQLLSTTIIFFLLTYLQISCVWAGRGSLAEQAQGCSMDESSEAKWRGQQLLGEALPRAKAEVQEVSAAIRA